MVNLTSVGITSGVPSSGTGTVSTIDQLLLVGSPISDGSSAVKVTITGASSLPTSSMSALVVSMSPNGINPNGQATMLNSAPVTLASNQTALSVQPSSIGIGTQLSSNSFPIVVAPQTLSVAVTPVNSTAIYTAGNVIGGIMTFANILSSLGFNGILESITGKFKDTTSTGTLTVNLFKASPSNGTYTDKTAPTWNSSDAQFMLGTYSLSPQVPFAATSSMAIYNLDGIGKAIATSTNGLYVVATVGSSITPNSTNTFTLELSVLPG